MRKPLIIFKLLNRCFYKNEKDGFYISNDYKLSIMCPHNLKLIQLLKIYYIIFCLCNLPIQVLKKIQKETVTIKLTSLEEIKRVTKNDYCAFFSVNNDNHKAIFISYTLTFNDLKKSLFHEFGHLIDFCIYENTSIKGNNTDIKNFYSTNDAILYNGFVKDNHVFEDDYCKDSISQLPSTSSK